MNKRITLSVNRNTETRIKEFATRYDISVSEAIRSLMGVGFSITREMELGNKIHTVDKNEKEVEIVFPHIDGR